MLWQVRLNTDRPSLRREDVFLSLQFESEAGEKFTSNSVPADSIREVYEKIYQGMDRHYRDKLSIFKNRFAPLLEDLFHPFFPNPVSLGKGFSQIFNESNHELIFIVSEPKWLWFPLELFYFNQQFLGLRHCVIRQSIPIHELATRGVLPPAANQDIWAVAGDADAGEGLWAEKDQLIFSARRIGEHLSNACENKFTRPASESWVAKMLPSNGHIYFIGHSRPGQSGVEPGFFLLNQWHSPKELFSQENFQPSILFLNSCHSAHIPPKNNEGSLSFPELIIRKKIPLFIGHTNRLVPEIATVVADHFFENFYSEKKSLSESWREALGANNSIQLKDGSTSLLGFQFYAPHPRTRLLESSDQASMHRLELPKISQGKKFKQPEKAGNKNFSTVSLVIIFTLILVNLVAFILIYSNSTEKPVINQIQTLPISKSGEPVIKNGIRHYTLPWLINGDFKLEDYTEGSEAVIHVFEQDVKIASSGELLIPPGHRLLFYPKARLVVHGKLSALGTEDKPVIFNSINPEAKWSGIFIGPETKDGLSPQTSFEYCVFKNGNGVPLNYKPVQPDLGENWFEHDTIEIPPFGRDYLTAQSNRRGGAVLVWRCQPIFINCVFENNQAWMGGALYFRNVASKALVYDCQFRNNQSEQVGGSIFMIKAQVEISDCLFEKNRTGNAGGAITVFRDSALELFKTDLDHNQSGISGGALYFYTGQVRDFDQPFLTHRLSECQFTFNQAGRDGGALSVDGMIGNLEMSELKFSDNSLHGERDTMEGGALFIDPETDLESEMNLRMKSIRLIRNVIFWNEEYASQNQGIQFCRGSAAYFGRLANIQLKLSNWIANENVSFSSEQPIEYDSDLSDENQKQINALLNNPNNIKNNRKEKRIKAKTILTN